MVWDLNGTLGLLLCILTIMVLVRCLMEVMTGLCVNPAVPLSRPFMTLVKFTGLAMSDIGLLGSLRMIMCLAWCLICRIVSWIVLIMLTRDSGCIGLLCVVRSSSLLITWLSLLSLVLVVASELCARLLAVACVVNRMPVCSDVNGACNLRLVLRMRCLRRVRSCVKVLRRDAAVVIMLMILCGVLCPVAGGLVLW